MKKEFICVVCPVGCRIVWEDGLISGNNCERGFTYINDEINAPKRNFSSTVRVKGEIHRRLPVKTSSPIKKELILLAVEQLNDILIIPPVVRGDVILKNVLGTGVDFIATRSIYQKK